MRVNLLAANAAPTFRAVRSGRFETPAAAVRAVLGGTLGVATLALAVTWLWGGTVDWRLGAFVSALWVFWAVFHDTVNLVVRPLMEILTGVVYGTADAPAFTLDEETAFLERLLESSTADRHRKILTAVRLAEIYRTHQHDPAKADRLLAEMRVRYPEARELDGTPRP